LNGDHIVDKDKILKRITYHHPLFDAKAINAQEQLPELNYNSYQNQVFFCGSYFGYGFHEDALKSSLQLAEYLSGGPLCH
jgi:predicted NAD/FAD-binding protein